MKKLIIFLNALLIVSLLALNVNARVDSSLGEEGTDYYEVESSKAILQLDFEGEGTWGDKNGLYSPASYEEGGKLVYTGAASWTKFMVINPNEEFKNGILSVDVVFELVGVKEIYATARQGYASNAAPDILRESGVQNIEYTESGAVKSYA